MTIARYYDAAGRLVGEDAITRRHRDPFGLLMRDRRFRQAWSQGLLLTAETNSATLHAVFDVRRMS
jgi:hypothetical protein